MPHRELAGSLDTEGCPTVFLEARAHGKSVVGGRAGGVNDAVLHGQTGFIVDGKNAAVVVMAVETLLSDPNLARTMREAGREYVAALTPERNTREVWRLSSEIAHDYSPQKSC